MKSSERKLRPAVVITIVFICVAVVLTFFSKTIYGLTVPTVHVEQFSKGSLRKTQEASVIVLPRQPREIYVPERMMVKEVLVKDNDDVKQGDVLAKLDVSELELRLGEQRADYERLVGEQQSAYGQARNAADLDVENAQKRIDALQAVIDEFSEVKSPIDGKVALINAAEGKPAAPDVSLLSVFDPQEGFSTKCVMDASDAAPFLKGDSGEVERQGGNVNAKGSISRLRMMEDGRIEFTVEIDDSLQVGEMIILHFSKNTAPYPSMVPLEAIVDGGYIYVVESKEGLMGEEYIARRVVVQILNTDDTMAAVSGTFNEDTEQVVVSSDTALSNGRVQIYHEEE